MLAYWKAVESKNYEEEPMFVKIIIKYRNIFNVLANSIGLPDKY
jgi:hypothetical protein